MLNKFTLSFFGILFGWPSLVAAATVNWIQIKVLHSYSDIEQSCSAIEPGGDLYFGATFENGKPMRVVLSNFPYIWPYEPIYRAREIKGTELDDMTWFRDVRGHYWLKSWKLSEDLLRWVLYYPAQHTSYCPLPQLLQTLSPSPATYTFETDDINEGILISYSQRLIFQGTRMDGQPFQAKLRMVQRISELR